MLSGSDLHAARGRMRVHNLAPIGEAVMNQTIAAGIGNVYKSETLFLAGINPRTRVGELTGRVVELPGSERGTLSHTVVLRNAGYEIQEKNLAN